MYFCLKICKITEFHLKCVLPPSSTQFFLVNFLLLHPPTPDLDAQGNAHCPQCSTMSTSTLQIAQCTVHSASGAFFAQKRKVFPCAPFLRVSPCPSAIQTF